MRWVILTTVTLIQELAIGLSVSHKITAECRTIGHTRSTHAESGLSKFIEVPA